jgi:hypothetical protein
MKILILWETEDTKVYGARMAVLFDSEVAIGSYPIVTLQYSSTTLYQVSYYIQ